MADPDGGAITFGGQVRAPNPERRAASRLHPVGHSVGLVVIAEDLVDGEFSFRVTAEGEVVELGGWEWAGPTIGLADMLNAPANLLAVHSVLVDGDDPAVLVGLRQLVEEHNERYAGCQVWISGAVGRGITAWVHAGCPEPWVSAAPADEDAVT